MGTELTLTCETLPGYKPGCPMFLWLLRGPEGVVQFKYSRHQTEPGLCPTCERWRDISEIDPYGNCWQAWDLGYHSPRPRYDGHEPIDTDKDRPCAILRMEAHCYYDGTSLGATELLKGWWASGGSEEWLKAELTGWYQDWLVDDAPAYASPITALTEAVKAVNQP